MSISPEDDWRIIPEFPNYEINAQGAIRTVLRHVHTQQVKDKNGNWTVTLYSPSKRTSKIRRTSYLMAIAFHPDTRHPNALTYTKGKIYVNHIDGDLSNLQADNIQWYDPKREGGMPEPDDEPWEFDPDYPEIWRIYIENPNYQISNYGRVRGRTGSYRILQEYTGARKHRTVVLRNEQGSKTTTRYVNQLVAEAFVPKDQHPKAIRPRRRDDVMDSVWHIDGNVLNCRADNLLWETRSRVIEWNKQNSPEFDLKLTYPDGREVPRHRMSNVTGKVYRSMEELAVSEGYLLSDVKYVYYSLAEYIGDPHQMFTVVK